MRMWTSRDSRIRRSRAWLWPAVLTLMLWQFVGLSSHAADEVQYMRRGRSTTSRRAGQIIDYAQGQLVLQVGADQRVQIPAEQVIAIRTDRVAAQSAADRFLADGYPAQALTLFRRAIAEETRPWMRRWILADMSRCYAQLDQIEQACDTFLLLIQGDAQTPWFDAIPLCWTARPAPAGLERQLTAWRAANSDPVRQLLAGSWMLTQTADQRQAVELLRQLQTASDSRVAKLANAQLWRTRLTRATADDVAAWSTQLDQIPKSLRAGPYYLLGKAHGQVGQHERAALALMHVPISYAKHRRLAAEALWETGQQLEQLKQVSEAVVVYRELTRDYDTHALAASARQRIDELSAKQ